MSLAIWNSLIERLKSELDPTEFQIWIKPLRIVYKKDSYIALGCPNNFHRSWIRDHYLTYLQNLLLQFDPNTVISLEITNEIPISCSNEPRQLELPRLSNLSINLNKRYIFKRFIAGRSNEFACAAAKAMAEKQHFFSNALFLISDTGLGKSHLIQAVGHYVLNQQPATRVTYLTTEDFANQMVIAIRNKRMDKFKDYFRRGCDLLLLEEIHFLAGKDKTQEELSFTLDALWNAGSKVIFTGNCLPHQLKGLKKNLLSRLEGGITALIDLPDITTRIRILDSLAREEGIEIKSQVLEYMAQELNGDVRWLQSALIGLIAKGSLTSRAMDLSLAAEIIGQVQRQLKQITPEIIRDLVAQTYGLAPIELTSKSRRKSLTKLRNLTIYLCRRHTNSSLTTLGRIFNRDHSTIIYGVEQIERFLNIDQKLARELSFLEQRLGIS